MRPQIYRCGYLENAKERNQMLRLIKYLERDLSSREENCTIIVEPRLTIKVKNKEINRKPDAIILKDYSFFIIEMKGFSGEFKADCREGELWKSINGSPIQPQDMLNPYDQASHYRNVFLRYLEETFDYKEYAPGWAKKSSYKMNEWLEQHIYSWVVTEEASQPTIIRIDRAYDRWFDVIPLNKLSGSLSFYRSRERLLNETQLKHFIDSVGAEPTTLSELFRGQLVEDLDNFVGLVPQITQWIEEGKRENVGKALDFIKELDLKWHLPHVTRTWEKSTYLDVRKKALLILMEWQYPKLGSILNDALLDKEREIVEFALDYILKEKGFPETIPSLSRILFTGPQDLHVSALNAVASSGHTDSGTIIYRYAEENLFNKPFEKFQPWSQKVKAYLANKKTQHGREEFSSLEREQNETLKRMRAVINGLGKTQYQKSLPWLFNIISEPTSIGFESNDYELLNRESNFYNIFEAACEAIGKIRDTNQEAEKILLNRLSSAPDDFKWCIIDALGNLGSTAAVPKISYYVRDPDNPLFSVAVKALTNIGSSESFDILTTLFRSDPKDDRSPQISVALQKIDRYRFLDLLLQEIMKRGIDESNRFFIEKINPLYSAVCPLDSKICSNMILGIAEALFPLLKTSELTDSVSWVLGRLFSNKYVAERALGLTKSQDPVEKAGAITILGEYFIQCPEKLAELDSIDNPIEVRRIVVALLAEAKMYGNLYKYANDEDSAVRQYVFNAFPHEKYLGEFYLVSDKRSAMLVKLEYDENFLCIDLDNKLWLIPRVNVLEAQLTNDREETYGTYLKVRSEEGFVRLLLVPVVHFLDYNKTISEELIQLLSANNSSSSAESRETMNWFWDKIPEEHRERQRRKGNLT